MIMSNVHITFVRVVLIITTMFSLVMCTEDCSLKEPTFEDRIVKASVILTGKVLNVSAKNQLSLTYSADVEIIQIFKGENVLSKDLLAIGVVNIKGFGNVNFCKGDVKIRDTRIFFINTTTSGTLLLSSSVGSLTLVNLEHTNALVKDIPYVRPKAKAKPACDSHFCAFGAICRTKPGTNDPYCECVNDCHGVFSPVCGSDNVTYANECRMKLASCTHDRLIVKKYPGQCDIPDPCQSKTCHYGAHCVASIDGAKARCQCSENCYDYGDNLGNSPVCGDDGRDYKNTCDMKRYACKNMIIVRIKYFGRCDPCNEKVCVRPQVCQLDDQRRPVCRCNSLCTAGLAPVCGSDGRRYSNECIMNLEACKQRKIIRVVKSGDCNRESNPCFGLRCNEGEECSVDRQSRPQCMCPKLCEPVLRQVCGSDGVTYDNECEMRRQACLRKKLVTIQFRGPCVMFGPCKDKNCPLHSVCMIQGGQASCECKICSEEFKPVCGSNGISYSNECKLKAENCEKTSNITIKHIGLCSGCQNVKCEFYSICESDGQEAKCVCPSRCVKVESKVCGTNGMTYINECELRVDACQKKQFIMIQSIGACDLCADVKCRFGAKCEHGRCICPMICPSVYKPVCASNRETYPNECQMRRAACSQNMDFEVVFNGECDKTFGGPDSPGSGDGSGVTVCDPSTCNFGGECRDDGQGGETCVCDFYCEIEMRLLVCGSDGRNYGNRCEMEAESCRSQTPITEQPRENCEEFQEEACDGGTPLKNKDTGEEYDCNFNHDVCPAGSYCHKRGAFAKCCPQEATSKTCRDTEYGCCPDHQTPALGTHFRGCPSVCKCNSLGSFGRTCNPQTRQCVCKPGVGGHHCDRCDPGFWGLHKIADGNIGCVPCMCNAYGSTRDDCEQTTGRCMCKAGIYGMKCSRCKDGSSVTPSGCNKELRAYTSCEDIDCQYSAKCRVLSGVPECVCEFSCEDETTHSQLVCGSDSQTYGSPCQLALFSCRLQKPIDLSYKGACNSNKRRVVKRTTLLPKRHQTSKFTYVSHLTYASRLVNTKSTIKPRPPKGIIDKVCPRGGDCGIENGRCRLGVCKCLYGYIPNMNNTRCSVLVRPSDAVATTINILKDACSVNPCINGGTCRLSRTLGFTCLCPLGKGGPVCNDDISFSIPSFSGESYVELPRIHRSTDELKINMRIWPLNENGIILYNAQNSGAGSDYVSLTLRDGFVEFKFDLGSGSLTLRSNKRLSLNQSHSLSAKRNGRDGLLAVDDDTGVKGSSPAPLASLNLHHTLYLGYIPTNNSRIFERIGVNQGFQGCIDLLEAGSSASIKVYKLGYPGKTDIISGRHVLDCADNPCNKMPCQNGGTCISIDGDIYQCICPNTHRGFMCEKAASICSKNPCEGGGICREIDVRTFSCLCPLGLTGDRCQKVSNPKMVSPLFNGSSYIELPLTSSMSQHFHIEVLFQPMSTTGMLLFATQYPHGRGDFISLSLTDGVADFRYNLGGGVAHIKSEEAVSLYSWHRLVIERRGKTGTLIVDDWLPVAGLADGDQEELNLASSIYVGGYANFSDVPKQSGISAMFDGVIQQVYINYRRGDKYLSTKNLFTYNGPPCDSTSCLNSGVCLPRLDRGECMCGVGYLGNSCQYEAKSSDISKALEFSGNTFLKYPNNINTSNPNEKDNDIKLSFRTVKMDGTILFISKGDTSAGDYMSMSVVGGKLEFSYNLGKQVDGELHIIRPDVQVSDGRWHEVSVKREARRAVVTVDDDDPREYFSPDGSSQLNTDGYLWIGGKYTMPSGLPQQYYMGFIGCVKDVYMNGRQLHLAAHRVSSHGTLTYCGG